MQHIRPLQAVNNSDFAIVRFHFLRRLLQIHGCVCVCMCVFGCGGVSAWMVKYMAIDSMGLPKWDSTMVRGNHGNTCVQPVHY